MTSGSEFTGTGLPLLAAVVLLGAVLPVVPTGAAVSAAAAVAVRGNYALPDLGGVLVFGAAGAYGGDVITYALLRWGGERIGGLLRRRAGTTERLAVVEDQLEAHQVTTLLVSRLIPGGRIPVLLAAAVAGYPFKKFAVTDTAAAALWSVVYAAVGVLGGSLFPHPWEGIVAAVALAVGIGALSGKLRGLHDRHTGHAGTAAPDGSAARTA